MLTKTNEVSKDGSPIYIDSLGDKIVVRRGSPTKGKRIPDWCFKYISPIQKTGIRWDLKKDCVVRT